MRWTWKTPSARFTPADYCSAVSPDSPVLGVNREELQASIDAALTFGILWLDACRNAHAGKLGNEGLKVFVPANTSALIRERMAHLNRGAAKWELYELDEREDDLRQMEMTIRWQRVHAPCVVLTMKKYSGDSADPSRWCEA